MFYINENVKQVIDFLYLANVFEVYPWYMLLYVAVFILFFLLKKFFYFFHHTACGLLVAPPGTEPTPPALQVGF